MVDIKSIQTDFEKQFGSVKSVQELEDLRIAFLGKKGSLTEIFKQMGGMDADTKKSLGQEVNELKNLISDNLTQKKDQFLNAEKSEKLSKESLDVSLPGKISARGAEHPISIIINDIVRIFSKMGFAIAEGPELEKEYYNFDALNIPEHHPARDEQDSFYIQKGYLMRTQTSGVQIRVMEQKKPPLAIIAPGRCYRNDTVDATHSPIFHQIEGLVVDKHVSFSDLKGVLALFAKEMFGEGIKVRFRPDFFPFTEPSAEVAFTCFECKGKGCPKCKKTGWIEVAGCGMVDPEVFKYVGIDYQEYKGYAFGMGIERIAMLKYGIPDIRLLYENETGFLNQFK